jgi:hypothetical protein
MQQYAWYIRAYKIRASTRLRRLYETVQRQLNAVRTHFPRVTGDSTINDNHTATHEIVTPGRYQVRPHFASQGGCIRIFGFTPPSTVHSLYCICSTSVVLCHKVYNTPQLVPQKCVNFQLMSLNAHPWGPRWSWYVIHSRNLDGM